MYGVCQNRPILIWQLEMVEENQRLYDWVYADVTLSYPDWYALPTTHDGLRDFKSIKMTNEDKDNDRLEILGLTGNPFSEPDVVGNALWSIRQRILRDTVIEQSRNMRSNKCPRTTADRESEQREAHVVSDKAYTDALRKDQESKRAAQRTTINAQSSTKQRRVNVAWSTRVITVVKDDTLGEVCEFFAAVFFPAATRQAVLTSRTKVPDTSQIKLQALSNHLKNEVV